ncbi:type II toxin-antitoxin system RelE/ParE family toxin [uncultured Fibrella sp.]|uniref:type II toxin-antitoxin system RelE/ParE family toxin n=1 Tax=uncultured Fibrella sp. TaxID=1284596 RepID=UPI0035CC529F
MAATVNWSQEAEDDFNAVCTFLDRQSAASANRWGDEVIHKIELLTQFPEMGRIVPEKRIRFIREVFAGDYRIIYSYQNSIINLLTIKHMASQLGTL